MSNDQSATSMRFFVQMLINIFVCNKAQQMIAKRVMVQEKITKKSIFIYIAFAITLLLLNQTIFMFFKNSNLYQKIGASRSLNAVELKAWAELRRAELFREYSQNPKGITTKITQLQQVIGVLTHPARRLSYDSFGLSDAQYAWAFKYPSFILSTIIGSGSFFVICTFVSMMNKKKSDLKEAFKVQIFAMILLFIWQVDLILSTETRINNNKPDLIDYVYTAFPIFQRRQMLKAIVIPCMSLVECFVRFFMMNGAEKKLLKYATLLKLQKITMPVRDSMGSINNDNELEEKVRAGISKIREKKPLQAEIYDLQRQNLKLILQTHRQEFVPKQKMAKVVNYFVLK